MRTTILFLFLVCSAFIPGQTLSTSLTALYCLQGNAIEPTNNLNGTLSVVTPTVDRFNNPGSACYFTGANNSYIELPDDPLLKPTNEITFSAWVKPTSLTSAKYVVFTRNTSSLNYIESYALGIDNSGSGVYKLRMLKSGANFFGNAVISINTWYHVAFTITNSNIVIYVNGQLDGSLTSSASFNYQPGKKVYLGGSNDALAYLPYIGIMDNVRFYNRALSASEISQLYSTDPSCSNPGVPVASFSVSPAVICAGGNVILTDLSTNNPTGWNWQTPGANTASSSSSGYNVFYPNPGSYVISLSASNNAGPSNTATQTIVVNPSPVLNLSSSNLFICSGNSATLSVSGANTYTWSNNVNTAQIFVTPAFSTNYTVNGTNSNGCVGSSTISQVVLPKPSVILWSSHATLCAGSSATITGNGASTYTWNNGSNTPAIVVSPVSTAQYSVSGTDNNGCINSATITQVVVACEPVGIEAENNAGTINLYPNPFGDSFYIESTIQARVVVKDLLGRVIYAGELRNKDKIDLGNYSEGFYYVTIKGEALNVTRKLLKQ